MQREHQLAREALAAGMLGDELPELADQLGMLADSEVGVDERLERGQTLLLQAGDLGCREGLKDQVSKRRTTP